MEYILKGENNYNDPLGTVLQNRGITLDLFNVGEEVIEDYDNYDNINEGVGLYLKHINGGSKIVFPIDSDVDGGSSFASIFRYTKDVFDYDNIHYKIHTGKQHGLSEDIIIEDDVDLVVLTDSSSNDYEQHKKLKERGIDVLVIDHHESDKYSEHALVINNQLSRNVKNKNFAGVGVTYKFLKALDDHLFEDKADDFLDILALGNIADVMSHKEPETRYYTYRGLQNINNPFIKALMEISSFELEGKMNIEKIGWTIAPKLNGTIRSGTMEEKEKMFQAFISNDYEFCLEVANMCKKVKARQDSGVKSAMKTLEKKIELNENDKCIILETSSRMKSNYTGLVAGKLASKYGIPVLLYKDVKEKKGIVGGSCRGNNNISIDLKADLINSDLMEFAEGHSNACGYQIKREHVDKLKDYLNNLYKDKKIISGKTHEVDFILDENAVSIDIIRELSEYEDEWGNGIDIPLIVFKDVMMCIEDDNIKGTRSKNMIFEYNGIKFIKKFLSNVIKNQVLNQGIIFATIVGKCVQNHYNGNIYPQVEIVDIEIL